MAANLFGRYVWLIDLIRRKRPTLKEINEHWRRCGLSYGEEDAIPRKTFDNHKKAIADIFGIDIECDRKHDYRYYIADADRLEDDTFRSWPNICSFHHRECSFTPPRFCRIFSRTFP